MKFEMLYICHGTSLNNQSALFQWSIRLIFTDIIKRIFSLSLTIQAVKIWTNSAWKRQVGNNLKKSSSTSKGTLWLTVQVTTTCFTGMDSTKHVNILLIQQKRSSWIQKSKKGGQLCSDTCPYETSIFWLRASNQF